MRRILAISLWMIFLVGCGPLPTTPAASTPTQIPSPQPAAPQIPSLVPWTADNASQLIQTLHHPELLPEIPEAVIHEALLLALQQARWSFPQASQAFDWYWQEASLRAQGGSSNAASLFGELIITALQSGAVTSENLTAWLAAQEPGGTFTLTNQTPPAASDYAALLEFSLTGQPAYFWITRQDDLYQVSLIASGNEFRPSPGAPTSLRWQDLTGDGFPEAWIIQPNASQRIEMASVILYDLGSGSAQQLSFSPALPMLPVDAWQVITENGCAAGLQVGLRLDGGSALCEYLLPVTYQFDGNTYRLTDIGHPTLPELVAAGLSEAQARLCLDLTVDWLRANTRQDNQVSLQLLETLMVDFPYGAEATLYVGLYPADELDRARFELGLKFAQRGDLAGVQRWMLAILSQPSFEGSPWQAQAQAFLEAYLPEREVRRACLASQACLGTGRLSLNQLVALMQPQDWTDPIAFLQQSGIAIAQHGAKDFTQDGTSETWWLENTGSASVTLRILANFQGRPRLNGLELPSSPGLLALESLEPLRGQPVYRARIGSDSTVFLYVQQEPEQAPAVWALAPYRTQVVQAWYRSFFKGEAGFEIAAALQVLQGSPYFNCAQPSEICQPSAQLAYLTALYLERAGDLRSAAEAYWQMGEAFPASAYAVLARARIAP